MQTSFARHYPLCKQRVAPLKRRTAPCVSLNENLNLMYSGELNSIELRKHFKFLIFSLMEFEAAGRCDPRDVRHNRLELGRDAGRNLRRLPRSAGCCVTSARGQRRRLANFVSLTMAPIVNLQKKKTPKKTISIRFVSSSSPVLPPGGESHLVSVSRAATWRRISTGKKNSLKFDGK